MRVKWGDRPARLTKEHHYPTQAQAVEALIERGLTNRIVDNMNPLVVREPLDLGLEIDLCVEDDLVRAGRTRQERLLLGRNRAKHPRATLFCELDDQPSGTARSGMHQNIITEFDRIGTVG